MSKPRVLLVGDHGGFTGFELVVRSIGDALQASGQYEVLGRGVGYDPNASEHDYSWPVKPVSDSTDDPLGIVSAKAWLAEDAPDCVLFVNDLWNVSHYLGSIAEPLPTVAYYPVDTPNLRWVNALAVGAISVPVTYTQFGASETARAVRTGTNLLAQHASRDNDAPFQWLTVPHGDLEFHMRADRLARAQDPAHYEVTPHGLDRKVWYAMDKAWCRKLFGIPDEAFVITNINTNQFRKRLDTTIRIFARVARERSDALLVLHCAGGDRDGWDLAQLVDAYGLRGRVRLIHQRRPYLTEGELRALYNTADININTSGGEGWGLCSWSSAACGIPQAVPDWSNNQEIWLEDEVLRFPVADYRHEPRGLNTAHCLLDTRACSEMLIEFGGSADLRQRLTSGVATAVARQPSWEEVGRDFSDYVMAALNEPAAEPMRFSDWPSYAQTPLVDPLAQFDVG